MKYQFLLCFLLLFGHIYGQDIPSSLSLQEAVDYALENNRQSKNAAREIDAAKQQKWETTATGLPQLDAKINYQNFLKQQISVVPAEFFGGNPGEFAQVIFGTKQNATATATLNQLLFDGSYLVGLQSAKVFLEISENAKVKTDLEVRKAVINAYGNVLISEESVSILEKNIVVVDQNLNEITKIYENGLEEQESVEQLQITLSNLKSNLTNVRRLRSIAYQMLNITLGIEFNATVKLTDDLETLAIRNISLNTLDIENIGTLRLTPTVENPNHRLLLSKNTKSSEKLL